MEGNQLPLSYATSSLIPVEYFEYSAHLPEQGIANSCSKFVFDFARRIDDYYLPVNLPTPIQLIPADVVFWLVELRHRGDSTDLVQELHIEEDEDDQGYSVIDDEILRLDEINANINEYLEKHAKYQNKEFTPNITVEIDKFDSEDICDDFYQNRDDTVLNLDLHRKKTLFNTYNNNESNIVQDWEKLTVQSVYFNCLESEVQQKSSGIMNSFWALNPVYSQVDPHNGSEQSGSSASGYNIARPKDQCAYQRLDDDDESSWSNNSEVFQEDDNITILNSSNNYNIGENDNINVSNQNAKHNTNKCTKKTDFFIHTLQDQECEVTSVKKCENILNNLDDMIQKFEDIQKSACVKADNVEEYFDVVCLKDNEFVQMCQTAEFIIEESLRCHVDTATSNEPKQQFRTNMIEHNSVGSDISDDVFSISKDDVFEPSSTNVTSPGGRSSRIDSFDINQIFDNGSNHKPPIPPKRKKKVGLQVEEANIDSSNKSLALETNPKEIKEDRGKQIYRVNSPKEIKHTPAPVEVVQVQNTKLRSDKTIEVCDKTVGEKKKNPNVQISLQVIESTDKLELDKKQNFGCRDEIKPREMCPAMTNLNLGENILANSVQNVPQKRNIATEKADYFREEYDNFVPCTPPPEVLQPDYKRRSNTLANECYSSFDSQPEAPDDIKIHLTKTKPISFSTFPPNDSELHSSTQSLNVNSSPHFLPRNSLQNLPQSNTELDSKVTSKKNNTVNTFVTRPLSLKSFPTTPLKKFNSFSNSNVYNLLDQNAAPVICEKFNTFGGVSRHSTKPVDAKQTKENEEQKLLVRARKGSNASDIAAWKQTLTFSPSLYHDDEMDPNSMPSNQWFSSHDINTVGSTREETNRSFPGISSTLVAPAPAADLVEKLSVANIASIIEADLRGKHRGPYHSAKAKSMLFGSSVLIAAEKKDAIINNPNEWNGVWKENMTVLREGALCRTKITEYGKKVRKNWMSSYAVLTEPFLLFFKDAKTFHGMKINPDTFRSELCIDLSGAYVEKDEKLSSRKHVHVVSTMHGLQVLLQAPSSLLAEQWYRAIYEAISLLPMATSCPRPLCSKESSPVSTSVKTTEDTPPKLPRTCHSKSIKILNKDESNEDLTVSAEEIQTKTKARLKKFFIRRPTKESLVKKGIYKDEPMFGCNLGDVVTDCTPSIPPFVAQCIKAIERKDENMKTDGLYRASGNLSQVQKIRLQVDQNRLSVLEEEEDVHVLTGALKLFFRELKKPLIPFDLFNKAIAASAVRNPKERICQFREIVQALPTANHNTLDFLLQHLLRVNKNKNYNRMHIPNIAIVFGPTLMWPEEESVNMALDLMKQNLVIECLLNEHQQIFSLTRPSSIKY